jgi:hypothetical protein
MSLLAFINGFRLPPQAPSAVHGEPMTRPDALAWAERIAAET